MKTKCKLNLAWVFSVINIVFIINVFDWLLGCFWKKFNFCEFDFVYDWFIKIFVLNNQHCTSGVLNNVLNFWWLLWNTKLALDLIISQIKTHSCVLMDPILQLVKLCVRHCQFAWITCANKGPYLSLYSKIQPNANVKSVFFLCQTIISKCQAIFSIGLFDYIQC